MSGEKKVAGVIPAGGMSRLSLRLRVSEMERLGFWMVIVVTGGEMTDIQSESMPVKVCSTWDAVLDELERFADDTGDGDEVEVVVTDRYLDAGVLSKLPVTPGVDVSRRAYKFVIKPKGPPAVIEDVVANDEPKIMIPPGWVAKARDPEPVKKDRTIVGLASYPDRESGMLATVAALSPQCDEMHVALNEYEGEALERVLKKLSAYPNVHARAYIGEEDLGCQNKFRAVGLCGPDDYFLTVDDDILYPVDYVRTMVWHCASFGGLSVVSLHGWTMRTSNGVLDVSNPRDTTFLAIASVDSAVPVHVNSNNTMCCSPNRIGLSFDAFMFPKNTGDDECLAVFKQKHGVPGFVIPHKTGWVSNQRGSVFANTALYLNRESVSRRIKWLHDMWSHWNIIPVPNRKLRFSIITPTYNDSAELARCLASVNGQTFDKNRMEMLVVDDASDDVESKSMMLECEKYKFVKYVRLPERRMAGGARNEGLRISGDSDYIVFLDSDDVLFSDNCLERLDRFIYECGDPDVVLCGFVFNKSKNVRTFSANSVEQMAEKQCVAPWTRVSKKDKTPQFVENRRMLNDVVQFLRQLDITRTVRSFDSPFIVYMDDNKKSCWHNRDARRTTDALSAMFLVGSDIISETFNTKVARERARRQLRYEYENHMKIGVINYNG